MRGMSQARLVPPSDVPLPRSPHHARARPRRRRSRARRRRRADAAASRRRAGQGRRPDRHVGWRAGADHRRPRGRHRGHLRPHLGAPPGQALPRGDRLGDGALDARDPAARPQPLAAPRARGRRGRARRQRRGGRHLHQDLRRGRGPRARPRRRRRRRRAPRDDDRRQHGHRRGRLLADRPAPPPDGDQVKADSGNALQILLLVGGISLVPAAIFTLTGFTRILIVLGFIRTGLGTPTAPPNQVLVGIALFLTMFVMAPTFKTIKKDAIDPLRAEKISQTVALERAEKPMREFMFDQTRDKDLALFTSMAKLPRPKTRADVPTYVLIPAFTISELKTAFQIGFLIFLPFLIIDLVVSSTLMSLGMMMLPPTFISLPFKILLFVLVDGWNLVTRSIVESFTS